MVKHGGAVLAVEGTYTDRRFNRMCTHEMVIKRRNGADEESLCWCCPLRMAERVPWSRHIPVGYDRRARGEAFGGRYLQ